MLSTLIESRPQRSRARGAGATSLVAHTLVITLAVLATATTRTETIRPEVAATDHLPVPVALATPSSPTVTPPSPVATPSSPPTIPFPTMTPVGIPQPTSMAVSTAVLAYPGSVPGSSLSIGVPGASTGGPTGPLSANLVDRAVRTVPGTNRPRYPETLRRDRIEGAVSATFVVDTIGRVEEGSFQVLESSHPLFERAVRDALRATRYVPAEAGGRRVRQLVEQRFLFTLRP